MSANPFCVVSFGADELNDFGAHENSSDTAIDNEADERERYQATAVIGILSKKRNGAA